MTLLKQSIKKHKIDIILLNETQLKWTPANHDKFNREMKELGRETIVMGADTQRWEVTPNQYLPGGIVTAIRGREKSIMIEESVYRGAVGNWIAVKFTFKTKTIAIINIYRIPSSSSGENKCSLTLYNLVEGKVKTLS